jgi:hypothetical protein
MVIAHVADWRRTRRSNCRWLLLSNMNDVFLSAMRWHLRKVRGQQNLLSLCDALATLQMIAILLMSCYWDSPHNQQGIRNRQSLIQLTIMFFSMSFNGLIAGCMCGTNQLKS